MKPALIFKKLLRLGLLAVVFVAADAVAAQTSRNVSPNVVVILSDDQGWGDLSLHGNRNLSTPSIDSLAREGAQFERFYVSPVCSPTRAEFLTGRYHLRGGVRSTSAGGERLDLDETTIAEVFRDAGYATAAFGKWHNGMQYSYHPNGRGFGEFYGFCSGHWGNYFSPPLEHNGRIVQGNGFVADDFTNHAIEFIQAHSERPFFIYLAYNTPHSPMQVPERFWKKFAERKLSMHHRDPDRENLQHTRAALALCENIDWNVGRLLKQLEASQLAQNTIVVYFCDNGPNGARWNGGMKGRKGSTDEGGVRSPLLIRWPARIAAGKRISPISAAIDLLPTLADLAGIPVSMRQPLDGRSLKALLLESQTKWEDRLIFSHWRGRVSARSQRFCLDHQGKLFDLANDPEQRREVQEQYPAEQRRLAQAVEDWKQALAPRQPPAFRPFPIGHPDYRYTQLPARDAVAHGNIRRSNRFPNCSFFSNWTDVEDFIAWEVEVLQSGKYAADIYYTCQPADVGVVLELSLNGNPIQNTVQEAHNPPEQGAENDRVQRMESYVKPFKPMRLGVIPLQKGIGRLKLRATKIPGSQAIDFRLLMLTRVP